MKPSTRGFTVPELLVSMVVLSLLVVFAGKLIESATRIATLGYKQIDVDGQVRPVFDRMAADFGQMIKRPDVDYYVKGDEIQPGNDRIAFFCNAPGYYPSSGAQSSLSLVAYRVNSDPVSGMAHKMERLGKGLLWNGVSNKDVPLIFGSGKIVANWPAATESAAADPDYELIGSQIFRFEYFYLLKSGEISADPGAAGLQDVAAISVTLAAIDPKSRALLTDDQIARITSDLKDFDPAQPSYDLMSNWQAALGGVSGMPSTAINAIRTYQHFFYLAPAK